MNIKQAKQEIINTVQAYLTKDETGEYAIPVTAASGTSVRTSGYRQDRNYGTGGAGVRDQSGLLYDHTPYKTECDRTAVYLKENL